MDTMVRTLCCTSVLVSFVILACAVAHGSVRVEAATKTTSADVDSTTMTSSKRTAAATAQTTDNQQIPKNNSTVSGNQNCTNSNSTDCAVDYHGIMGEIDKFWHENFEMIKRTLYVLMGLTGIVVIYFGVKYWRMRRRKTKKYGIVSSADNLELQPLDLDDEDDDMTVFETNGRARLLK